MLLICAAAALIVWFTPTRIWGGRGLVWADALGIAVYATYGAAKGLAWGVAPVPAAATASAACGSAWRCSVAS